MIEMVLMLLFFTQASGDSITPMPATKSYTKDVIISACIGLGFGFGAYYCKNTADKAYESIKPQKQWKRPWNNGTELHSMIN